VNKYLFAVFSGMSNAFLTANPTVARLVADHFAFPSSQILALRPGTSKPRNPLSIPPALWSVSNAGFVATCYSQSKNCPVTKLVQLIPSASLPLKYSTTPLFSRISGTNDTHRSFAELLPHSEGMNLFTPAATAASIMRICTLSSPVVIQHITASWLLKAERSSEEG